MKVVVCIKQVPDTNEVKIDPVTKTLIRDGVPSIINPDDKASCSASERPVRRSCYSSIHGTASGRPRSSRSSRYGR